MALGMLRGCVRGLPVGVTGSHSACVAAAASLVACAGGLATATATNAWQEGKRDAAALDKDAWTPLTLASRKQVTHNTHMFRFALPKSDQRVDLPVASCLLSR